jgi:hypothetical protein
MPDIQREEVTAKSGISKYLNKKAAPNERLHKNYLVYSQLPKTFLTPFMCFVLSTILP